MKKPDGIGLRSKHTQEILETKPDIGWLEVHTENYFSSGGPDHYFLSEIGNHYPLSFHGIGLSIGSVDPLNMEYLRQVKEIINRYDPAIVSDHLSWSSVGGKYFPDLYPLPFNDETLNHLVRKVEQAQEYLQRPLVLENISRYASFQASTMTEWDFMNELHSRSGCCFLLDINNIYVNSVNDGFQPEEFISAINAEAVAEVHLSGVARKHIRNTSFLIDTHDSEVEPDVWRLYGKFLERRADVPCLIEWDQNLPELNLLLEQQKRAEKYRMEMTGSRKSTGRRTTENAR